MRKRLMRRFFTYVIMACLAALPIYQLAGWYDAKKTKVDAVNLLYQVSLFQMELLGSSINEAGKARDTDQLNALKQAAYSANYTHERLTEAVGEERLEKLESVPELLQFILRLQIGGARTLKPEETTTLQEFGKLYKDMFQAYGELLASDGHLLSSRSDKVKKADKAMAELLKKNRAR